jgi:hypothetical protein
VSEFNNLPKRGPGRPKGSPNKIQKAAKDAIAEAAEKLGGVDRLVAWAREDPANERAFWATVYPKLLPLTVNANASLTVNWPVPAPRVER